MASWQRPASKHNAIDGENARQMHVIRRFEHKSIKFAIFFIIIPQQQKFTQISPTSVNFTKNSVSIQWPDIKPEPVEYTVEWLWNRRIGEPEISKNRHKIQLADRIRWKTAEMSALLKPVDLQRAEQDPQYMLDALEFFLTYGLLYWTNIPQKQGEVTEIGRRLFGYACPCYYG